MLFCSPTFCLFFLAVFALYWAAPWHRARTYLLLAASFVFYASWSWKLAVLICATTAADYAVALGMDHMHDGRRRKLLLHRAEIEKLHRETRERGLTLVPTKLYLKEGLIKVEIAVGRGKKLHDKRESERAREMQAGRERLQSRCRAARTVTAGRPLRPSTARHVDAERRRETCGEDVGDQCE